MLIQAAFAPRFLFLVGLEVDFSLFRRNVAISSSISLLGLVIPFGLGAAVSKGIYDRFVETGTVDFGTFLLFIGTANAITAFPVLARILTDENLLRDHVGVIVLSAGVGKCVALLLCTRLAALSLSGRRGGRVVVVLLGHETDSLSLCALAATSSAGSSSRSPSPSSTRRRASSSCTLS